MFEDLIISFFLAKRTITRGNKGTVLLTVLIMTLAFINLVFISAIMYGMISTIDRQSIDNMYGNIVIQPEDDEVYVKNVKEIRETINSVPGITGTAAHYVDKPIMTHDKGNDGKDIHVGSWILKSANMWDEDRIIDMEKYIAEGENLNKDDRDKIILGKDVAGAFGSPFKYISLEAEVGDIIKVRFGNGIIREYEVKGIFTSKSIIADQLAYISQKEMESVLGVHNLASEIVVKIDETGNEQEYIKKFREIGIDKEEIKVWDELLGLSADLNASFSLISGILSGIGTIVAGVTIFIVIYVSVVNKRRQIGILKAIGMRESIIINSFVLQALFYSIMGMSIGFFLLFSFIDPYFIKYPMEFPIGWVSLMINRETVIVSSSSLLVASIIGGVIPAWKGARETILKAIWG